MNIKKAQFLSGLDIRVPYEKARDAGLEIWLTERGNIYGYNNLVVDFRNIPDMLQARADRGDGLYPFGAASWRCGR